MSKDEKKVPLIYIEGGNGDYKRLMGLIGEITFDHEEADIIVFTGGSDVTPSLYGEPKLHKTTNNPERDAVETSLFHRLLNKPDAIKRAFVGICRGGQFLNVMNGGKLWQHVEGHVQDHPVYSVDEKRAYFCSSTHHQMMRAPTPDQNIPYKMLAYAIDRDGVNKRTKTEKLIHDTCKWAHDGIDIEAMWYPGTRSLCFQPHPEFEGYPDCQKLFLTYMNTHVLPSIGFKEAKS